MAKPIILAIDDDPEVLRAIERDLRHKYGSDYKIMRAESGPVALETLQQLKLRNDVVAVFISDQRMPQMTGVEFLEAAIRIFPDAKRTLLTAYADTDAAIKAINTVKVDYYLMKPWNPPEECLYPVIDDLLSDWRANVLPPDDALRVIGHQWSSPSHTVRDFLARNQIPFHWLNIESSPEARTLLTYANAADSELPVVIFADGTHLTNPTNQQLAEKVGLNIHAASPYYELVIVGGGPAGLAASVYGASEGLRTLMIEREAPGGQAGTSSRIENYLGFPSGLSGADLARRGVIQAKRFGVEILAQEARSVRVQDHYRILTLADGSEISCHALMISTGVSYRKLDVPGLDALSGAGVYYGAAMTEALSCVDDDVFIVGGANSAGQAAMYFAKYARQVVMLVRAQSLAASMSQYLIDQINGTSNILVRNCVEVAEAKGQTQLEELVILDTQTGTKETVPARALFIFIGAVPHTDWLTDLVMRDEDGFILTGPDLTLDGTKRPQGWPLGRDPYLLETSVPGIFCAGDVRHRSIKRVASAVGEGSIAIQFVHQYLSSL